MEATRRSKQYGHNNSTAPVLPRTWDHILGAVKRSLGPKDAASWLDRIEDLLRDPFFVKTPFSLQEAVKAYDHHPHLVGYTWVSPHPSIRNKMGYYCVWRPFCEMQVVFGEPNVRIALLENRMSKL